MRLLICILLSVITLYINTLAEDSKQAKDIYFKKLPADFIQKIDFDNPVKLRFDHTPENYNTVVNLIQIAEEESQELNYLCNILDTNRSLEMVPAIMRIVNDHRLAFSEIGLWDGPSGSGSFENQYYVSTYMIILLEKLYDFRLFFDESESAIQEEPCYYFEIPQKHKEGAYLWKRIWQADSNNYKKWGYQFYKRLLGEFESLGTFEDYQLNYIVNSKYRQDKDTVVWKKLMGHVNIDKDFLFIETDEVFNIKSMDILEHWMADRYCFVKLFDLIKDSKVISFERIEDAIEKFDQSEQKEIITSLLEKYIIRKAIIENPDRKFLKDSYILDKIKAFPFNPLYFTQLAKLSYEEKIDYILHKLKWEQQKDEFQILLDSTDYNTLLFLINKIEDVKKINYYDFYLEQASVSLGIPIDKYYRDSSQSLQKIYSQKSEMEFFRFFLESFNPKLYSNNKLNYSLVSEKLRSPLALAYADSYEENTELTFSPVLTLIRILELEHNTRLGFKYQFERYNPKSTQKRINAWIEYLESKGLINRN